MFEKKQLSTTSQPSPGGLEPTWWVLALKSGVVQCGLHGLARLIGGFHIRGWSGVDPYLPPSN